jgi:integrase
VGILAGILEAGIVTTAKAIGSAAQVASARPGVHRVADATGLYLKKGSSGTGSYFYRYRFRGERLVMGLGSADKVKLAEAKTQAREFSAQLNKGLNPAAQRAKERAEALAQAQAEEKRVTFAQAAASFLKAHGPSWKGRYACTQWWNPVRDYALPVIGDLLLDDIRVEHVIAVMKKAEKAGAKETARRLRARIESVLNAAGALGQRNLTRQNPADTKLISYAHPSRRKGERDHYRRRELDDAPATLQALKELAADSTALAAWVFMIATAARPSEALQARWSEIDLDKKLWSVPAERMKTTRKHAVPLSSIALAVLERQAKMRMGDAVFPGPHRAPLAYNAFAIAPGKAGVDAGTPHSWRSVFRDACGDRLRVDRDLAEAALSHTLGAVEGAYRRETAIEARRPVMEAYAAWLLDAGADVIAFSPRVG